MATIRPFMAIRPAFNYADKVAALPYDVMNSEEAREMVKDKPWSFLHVDKAEVDLPVGTDIYSDEVYEKAKDNLLNMIGHGVIDFPRVMAFLREIGYNGYFTFEVGGIFKPLSQRRPYEADTRLSKPPLSLKQAAERFLYEMGKCMLEAYDCFEE